MRSLCLANLIILLTVCACQAAVKPPNSYESKLIAIPEQGSFYHGVYPGGRSGEEDDIGLADLLGYEQSVEREVAWVYFSNNWYRSRTFPLETATWIREQNATPFIRLMLRSTHSLYQPERTFTLDAINKGDFDTDLKLWAQQAKAFSSPLIVEWGTEVNGDWFSWNARWNGKEAGAEKFRRAYRRIVETMRAEGADNIVWVFHVNAYDSPAVSWNKLESYYPGDDVIDWLGLSAYGPTNPLESEAQSLTEILDDSLPRLSKLAPNKPVFLLEFAAGKHPEFDAAIWADEAFTSLLALKWPQIRGFAWWNETWENDDNPQNNADTRVQVVGGLAEVFQKHLSSERVLSEAVFVEQGVLTNP